MRVSVKYLDSSQDMPFTGRTISSFCLKPDFSDTPRLISEDNTKTEDRLPEHPAHQHSPVHFVNYHLLNPA